VWGIGSHESRGPSTGWEGLRVVSAKFTGFFPDMNVSRNAMLAAIQIDRNALETSCHP